MFYEDFAFKILSEASYDTDKKQSDTAKNIIQEIKKRINVGNKITFNGEFVFTKIGDLEFYLFDRSTQTGQYYAARGRYAEFAPSDSDPKIYSFNNVFAYKGKKLVYNLDEESIYHEIIHYLDSKRGTKGFMTKAAEKQSAKNGGMIEYFNSPAEFNAHFMEFVFPNIESFIQNKNNFSSFEEFKNQIINYNKRTKVFFSALNDNMKKKSLKRLYTIYDNIKKNDKAGENKGIDASVATKKDRLSILQRIKKFFMNQN